METSAYFDDIPKQIAKRLRLATREIVVAVAWFTDQDLFDLLCRRAGQGVWVRLAVLNDRINVGTGRLNFQRLQDIGGEVFLIPTAGRNAIMHHKFCVIDGETVIVGSYNWTNRAQDNDENITVICGAEGVGADYLRAFDSLLSKHKLSTPVFDTTQIRQRLQVLRTLLKLADWDSVDLQIERISPAVAAMRLSPLIEALERRSADAASAWLDHYLARATALADATDQEVAFLKLELRSLEFQVTALSDERAEIERQIHEFSQRSTHAFGELMTRYLELRAEKQRRCAAEDQEAEAEAESAQADYEEYRDSDQAARERPTPTRLAPDDLKELKRLYRQASQKCHPDKVAAADRKPANELFVQLQAAYQLNDIGGVRAIHAAVREGNLFVDQSVTLTERESLGHAIASLRREFDQFAVQVQQLRRSETYRTLQDLDDLDDYFTRQREALERGIRELKTELADHAQEA